MKNGLEKAVKYILSIKRHVIKTYYSKILPMNYEFYHTILKTFVIASALVINGIDEKKFPSFLFLISKETGLVPV